MKEYIQSTEEKDINWFIDTVLIQDIGKAIDAGVGYLAFSLIAQAIETLGALLDEQDFNEKGLSEKRFALAIDELFAPINSDYKKFNRVDSPYYLWENLRCGMAHVLRPQSKVAFTGKGDKFKHLQTLDSEGQDSQLILVIENFYTDLIEACRRVKNKLAKKTHPKLKKGYILVTHVSEAPLGSLEEELSKRFDFPTTNIQSLSGSPFKGSPITGVAPRFKT